MDLQPGCLDLSSTTVVAEVDVFVPLSGDISIRLVGGDFAAFPDGGAGYRSCAATEGTFDISDAPVLTVHSRKLVSAPAHSWGSAKLQHAAGK